MTGLFLTFVFIALNGFFVAAEFALVKVSVTKLSSRVRAGDKRADAAAKVVARLDRYLSVTQLGITLASLGLGWIGQPAIEACISKAARFFSWGEFSSSSHVVAATLAFITLTFGHVLFGELVPKLVAIQRSERTAMAVAPPLRLVYLIFKPLLFILEKCTNVILRSVGLSQETHSEGKLSEDEIIGILVASTSKAPQGAAKAVLLERVLRFSSRSARHSMVPRVDVESLPIATSGNEAKRILNHLHYSRILLTRGRSMDEVAGYMHIKDFYTHDGAETLSDLTPLCREVLFVPETQNLLDVLRKMQVEQTPIAVVVDEYGGSSGLLTMEDLLEEIVGEIQDEFDEEPEKIIPVLHQENSWDVWDVDASVPMEALFALGIEGDSEWGAETVGAFLVEKLSRVPHRGDKVELADGSTIEVTRIQKRRVISIRLKKMSKKSPSEKGAQPLFASSSSKTS